MKNGNGSIDFEDGRRIIGFWENDIIKSGKLNSEIGCY